MVPLKFLFKYLWRKSCALHHCLVLVLITTQASLVFLYMLLCIIIA